MSISPLQKARAAYAPKLPPALAGGANVKVNEGVPTTAVADVEKIRAIFKTTFGSPVLTFEAGGSAAAKAINVGVILSGGQAPFCRRAPVYTNLRPAPTWGQGGGFYTL